MGFLGGGHIYIIIGLIIVLVIFGPGRLPELGGAVGKAIKEFRKAGEDLKEEVTRTTQPEPQPQQNVTAAAPAAPPAAPETPTPPSPPSSTGTPPS